MKNLKKFLKILNNLKYKIERIKIIAEFIDISNENNIINPNGD